MGAEETHGLGYGHVDDDPNVEVLLQTMDATSRWEATQRLRSWEAMQLDLGADDRLLDVGCGQGDAALGLAASLGTGGELVGVDASEQMIRAASSRAAATCRVTFKVGDAQNLDEPDGYFDVARSERTLQWLPDPQVAVNELRRVARPGGLVSLIDSDWSTFSIDIGDADIAERVSSAFRHERNRPSNIGNRLGDLARSAELVVEAATSATQVWTDWDPDETTAPTGCFSMSALADDLIDRGRLGPTERDRFVATVQQAARDGRFSMTLTMHAVIAHA